MLAIQYFNTRRKTAAGLFLLFAFVFFIRLVMQLRSPFACGIDGYYYALQIKEFLAAGVFHIPDSSPVLYLLTGIAAMGGGTVLSLKIGAALLGALPLIPGYLLGSTIGKKSSWGFLLAGLLSCSVSLSYLSIELFKNLGALSFLLFTLYTFIRIESGERSTGLVFAAGFFFLLTLLSHRSTALLALLYGCVLVFRILPCSLKKKLFLTGGTLAVFIGILLLGKGIHPADLGRFVGTLSPLPVLPLLSAKLRLLFPATLLIELSAAALVPWILIFFRKAIPSPLLRVVWLSLFPLFLPFWKLDGATMGFRLALVGVPLALIVLIAVMHTRQKQRSTAVWLQRLPLFLIPVLLVILPGTAYRPATDPPYARYSRLLASFSLPKGSVLICHRGLNLFYKYTTGNEGLSYIPDFPVPRERLWRLAAYVDAAAFKRAAQGRRNCVRPALWPYLLVREDVWQRALTTLPPQERELLQNSYNPFKKKPWYLRRQQRR